MWCCWALNPLLLQGNCLFYCLPKLFLAFSWECRSSVATDLLQADGCKVQCKKRRCHCNTLLHCKLIQQTLMCYMSCIPQYNDVYFVTLILWQQTCSTDIVCQQAIFTTNPCLLAPYYIVQKACSPEWLGKC